MKGAGSAPFSLSHFELCAYSAYSSLSLSPSLLRNVQVRMMYDDRIPPERIVVALNQERRGEFKKKKDKGRTEKAPREITYREVSLSVQGTSRKTFLWNE